MNECRCDVKATAWTIFMKLTEEWTVQWLTTTENTRDFWRLNGASLINIQSSAEWFPLPHSLVLPLAGHENPVRDSRPMCYLSLYFSVIQVKHQKIKSDWLLSVCVIIVTRQPIGDSHQDLPEVQEQQTHVSRTIYTCVILSSGCVYVSVCCSANGWGFTLKLGLRLVTRSYTELHGRNKRTK